MGNIHIIPIHYSNIFLDGHNNHKNAMLLQAQTCDFVVDLMLNDINMDNSIITIQHSKAIKISV